MHDIATAPVLVCLQRVIKDGHGAALDAMRCFSVLVRPGGSVVADGGRAVLQVRFVAWPETIRL